MIYFKDKLENLKTNNTDVSKSFFDHSSKTCNFDKLITVM
jgi:hypothetical protein